MPYDLVTRVLDVNRELVAFATQHITITTTRRLNEPAEVTITLPWDQADALHIGAFVQRVRVQPGQQPEIVATGRVGRRDVLEDGSAAYTAFLDAILLANNVTPANYTNVLRNILLEDLARQLVDGWRPLRADWSEAVGLAQIDLATEPGRVLIEKQADGSYYSFGSIMLRFDADDVDAWKAWDRIRWESDYYDNVRTTVQYRSGATTVNVGAWSAEQQGADPAGVGISLAGVTDRFVEVRINLYTDDTTTPAEVPEGEVATTFGFTPRVFGLEVIARTVGPVTIGQIDVADDVFARTVEADALNALRILQEACEATDHEFTVRNGELFVASEVGEDRTNDVILQDGLNAQITVLRDDDEELVNRVHAYGSGSGLSQPYVFLEDVESVATFGPYENTASFAATSQAELEAAATAWLADRAQPAAQFEVSGADVHGINLGDRLRIADPRTGTVVRARVTEVTETEDSEGRRVSLTLGDPPRGPGRKIIDRATEDKRRDYELPLRPPSIRVDRSQPGFQVAVGHEPRSRGVGFVIHFSGIRGFEPSRATERARGRSTLFDFPDVQPGTVYYVRAATFDRAGDVSEFTDEHPVRAGHVDPVYLDPDTQDALDDAAAVTGVVQQTIDVLNMAPDDEEQFSSVKQNAQEITSVVANLNGDPADPAQYTSIRQTAEEVAITAAKFDPWQFRTDDGDTIVIDGEELVSTQQSWTDEIDIAFARISVQEDEIDLRVRADDVVAAVNLDPSGVRILGEKVELSGDTTIDGTFEVRDGGATQVAMGSVGGMFGAPPGAVGLAAQLGAGIWVQGAPRLIYAGVHDLSGEAWSNVAPGGFQSLFMYLNVPGFGNAVVPDGKQWVWTTSVISERADFRVGEGPPVEPITRHPAIPTGGVGGSNVLRTLASLSYRDPADPNSWTNPRLPNPTPEGSYGTLHLTSVGVWQNGSTVTTEWLHGTKEIALNIYEIDA